MLNGATHSENESQRLLIAGPWVGEFGWELLAFQARLRALRRQFDRIIILGGSGKAPLYSDFGEYHAIDLPPGIGSANGTGRYSLDTQQERKLEKWCHQLIEQTAHEAGIGAGHRNVRVYRPDAMGLHPWIPTYPPYQRFIRFGEIGGQYTEPTVVLVTRGRALAPERNVPETWWDDLAADLDRCGIHTQRFLGNLTEGPGQLASADLAVGGSTGGLHLASLCGCPHFVWGPAADVTWAGGPKPISNELRYQIVWNPLGTPVVYEPLGWQPDVRTVTQGILNALESFGRRTGKKTAISSWYRTKWYPGRIRLGIEDLCYRFKNRHKRYVSKEALKWTPPVCKMNSSEGDRL